MSFLVPPKSLNYFSLCFFIICFSIVNLKAESPVGRSATEIEEQASKAEKFWNGVEIRRSVSLYRKAAELWLKSNDQKRAAFCYRKSGELALMIFDNKAASEFLQKSFRLAQKSGNNYETVFSLSLLTQLERQKGNFSQSRKFSARALEKSNSANEAAKAMANLAAGELTFDYGSFDESFEHFEKAYKFAKKTVDKDLRAKILLNLAYLNSLKGFKSEALTQLNQANTIWESLRDKRGLAMTKNIFGFIYTISNEKQKALEFYRQGETMFPEDVDFLLQAQSYSGIAAIYYEYDQLSLSKKYFEKALEKTKQAESDFGQLAILPIIAQINYREGNIEKSLKLYQESIELSKKLKSDYLTAVLTWDMGNIDYDKGNFDEAIAKYERSLKLLQGINFILPKIQNSLGKAFEQTGDFEKARRFYEESLELNRRTKDVNQAGENVMTLTSLHFIKRRPA